MFSGFSSTTDPLRRWRRRCVALAAGAAAVSIPTAAWALRSLPRDELQPAHAIEAASIAVASTEEGPAIDRSVFERNLWWVLPKSGQALGTEQAPKPAILPIAVDLIGVISVDGELVAALYDRRAQRLLLVRNGETVAEAKVSEVSNDRVTLTRADGELVLVRRRPGP